MNDWTQILLGLFGFGGAAKLLWPLLKARLDADSARAGTDETLHKLYTDALKEMRSMTEQMRDLHAKLNEAESKVTRLQDTVEKLTRELTDARKALEERTNGIN